MATWTIISRDRMCNYARIKIYEEHQLGDGTLSSTFIEDSSHPRRDISHRGRVTRREYSLMTKIIGKRSCTAHLLIVDKNLYFARFYVAQMSPLTRSTHSG